MFSVPHLPVITYWLALEDGNEHKRESEEDIEDDGSPEEFAGDTGRKDADVEKEEGEFEGGDFEEVDDFEEVEELCEFGDVVER